MMIKPSVPYSKTQDFFIKLNEEQIKVITKPGLPGWKEILPATQLFAQHALVNPDDQILLFGPQQGALAAHLARKLQGGDLVITDQDCLSLEMAQLTLEANGILSFTILPEIELPQKWYERFDKVFLTIPKGRQLIRRWLLQAYHALARDGYLYLAGANNSGIQSIIKDALELFNNGRVVAYKKHNRIAQFHKEMEDIPPVDWVNSPGIQPGSWITFSIALPGQTFPIQSLPGVFSYDHLDAGTEILLHAIDITPGSKILDVGCGYGIIGLYAAAKGASLVHLIDSNLLAIGSCKQTIALNHIMNAEVFTGDLLTPIGSQKYDQILSNPPFHAGFSVDYQIARALIEQSYQALNPGGQLAIVANRFIRYSNLIKDIFGNVSYLKETSKYHVLSGIKSNEGISRN